MSLDSAVRIPRSHRIAMAIPVRVFMNGEAGVPVEELTETMLVNGRGALIALGAPVQKGQQFRLVNLKTGKEIKCTVVNTQTDQKDNGKAQVGIAFDEPTPRYWGLYFPPDDWNTNDRKRPEPRRIDGKIASGQ